MMSASAWWWGRQTIKFFSHMLSMPLLSRSGGLGILSILWMYIADYPTGRSAIINYGLIVPLNLEKYVKVSYKFHYFVPFFINKLSYFAPSHPFFNFFLLSFINTKQHFTIWTCLLLIKIWVEYSVERIIFLIDGSSSFYKMCWLYFREGSSRPPLPTNIGRDSLSFSFDLSLFFEKKIVILKDQDTIRHLTMFY